MERRPPRKRGNAAKHNDHKEMNQWQEYSYTTTASSPTPTPR